MTVWCYHDCMYTYVPSLHKDGGQNSECFQFHDVQSND